MSVFDKNDNSKQVFERGTSKVQHRRPLVCVQGMGFVGAAMAVAVAKSEDADGDKNFTVVGLDLPTPSGRKRVDAINDGLFLFNLATKLSTLRCWNAVPSEIGAQQRIPRF